MVKVNLSRKLVSRCAAAALALIITFAGVSDTAYTSDSAISSQQTVETTAETVGTVTDETVAYSMATFKASQGVSTSAATTSQQEQAIAMVDEINDSGDKAVTTTKAAETSAATVTTKSTAATKAAVTTTKKAVTTTAKPAVTTAAATTTAAVTTTAKPVVTTAVTVPQSTGANAILAKPVVQPEKTYDTDYTHPWKKQTNQITVHWNAVNGAEKYMLFVYGGQYKKWTEIATTSSLQFTASGLNRETSYSFAVKAVSADGKTSELSAPVSIKTARIDYSVGDWQAMCRIVFHEVGGASGSVWDKPIVYVADCVANQYVCAKYTKQGVWPKYYSKYSSLESIIYTSGGFASSAVLARRGATYARVPQKVKLAAWGAAYGITYYNNIANDYNVFFWNSTSYAVKNSKLGYSIRTPWGNYVNIWRQYWG